MDTNETPVADQKLSSEENFSPDYELFSKKPDVSKKQNFLIIILGILFAGILIGSYIYFFR